MASSGRLARVSNEFSSLDLNARSGGCVDAVPRERFSADEGSGQSGENQACAHHESNFSCLPNRFAQEEKLDN